MFADRLAVLRPYSWMFLKMRAAEFVRYGITGAICVCLNVLIIAVVSDYLGMRHLVSTAACFVSGTAVSFCLNRCWTFRRREQGAKGDLARYIAVALVQLALFIVLCDVCVDLLHIPYMLSILVLSFVLAPVTFLLHRGYSFSLSWFG